MGNKMKDNLDKTIRYGLQKWAGSYRPDPGSGEQILCQVRAENFGYTNEFSRSRSFWKDVLKMDWFFHMENDWIIDHHASLRHSSYYVAANGHLLL